MRDNTDKLIIVLGSSFVGFLLFTFIPTLFGSSKIGSILSFIFNLVGWILLVIFFLTLGMIVLRSVFSSNKEKMNKMVSNNKSINDSDEVI